MATVICQWLPGILSCGRVTCLRSVCLLWTPRGCSGRLSLHTYPCAPRSIQSRDYTSRRKAVHWTCPGARQPSLGHPPQTQARGTGCRCLSRTGQRPSPLSQSGDGVFRVRTWDLGWLVPLTVAWQLISRATSPVSLFPVCLSLRPVHSFVGRFLRPEPQQRAGRRDSAAPSPVQAPITFPGSDAGLCLQHSS